MARPSSGHVQFPWTRLGRTGARDPRRALLILYLDTCVLVSLFVDDTWSGRARTLVRDAGQDLLVSDFAGLEFASAISGRARLGSGDEASAQRVFAAFDSWSARFAVSIEVTPADLAAADASIRRLDTALRTGDALHIAIADRIGATIATFDRTLAEAARERGVGVLS